MTFIIKCDPLWQVKSSRCLHIWHQKLTSTRLPTLLFRGDGIGCSSDGRLWLPVTLHWNAGDFFAFPYCVLNRPPRRQHIMHHVSDHCMTETTCAYRD